MPIYANPNADHDAKAIIDALTSEEIAELERVALVAACRQCEQEQIR